METRSELELLTVTDVSKILKCSPDNVRRLERAGRLRAIRVGSRKMRLFQRSAVERFLETRCASQNRRAAPTEKKED